MNIFDCVWACLRVGVWAVSLSSNPTPTPPDAHTLESLPRPPRLRTHLDHNRCESGVESENQHRSSEPAEHVHEQALVGTHL